MLFLRIFNHIDGGAASERWRGWTAALTFSPLNRLLNSVVNAGSDVNQGEVDDLRRSFRQQVERCHRVSRIRFCRSHRARRLLGRFLHHIGFLGARRSGSLQSPGVFCGAWSPRSKIRAARSGDAADREILAHQPGIIGIGIHAVAPRTLADRMAVASAA